MRAWTACLTGRAVLPALLLPLTLAVFTTDLAAQLRGPKHGDGGGWVNNPTGRNDPRGETRFLLRNESPRVSAARVILGEALLEATAAGTAIGLKDTNEKLGVAMFAADGPARCCIQLPLGFENGIVVIRTDTGFQLVVPVSCRTVALDVPTIVKLASANGLGRFSLSFMAFRAGWVDSVEVTLRVDLTLNRVVATL